jgi:outer membrane protein assembly factor BamD
MKVIRTLLLVTLAVAAIAGAADVYAQEGDSARRSKPTKEERRELRAQKITQKATEATQLKVREGKTPSYARLLKSTNYELMFTEGLRYYNMTKKDSEVNSRANLRKSQALFQEALRSQTFGGTSREDSLYYYYGCSFFMAQDFQESQEVFDNFRRQYGASKFIEDAEYKFAMGFYFLSPAPAHDQSVTIRAISTISEYMGRYPETTHKEVCDERMEELHRKLYTKSYENARLYYNIRQYKAAVTALNNAIDQHPESPYREELMYLATRSAYMFARNSVQAQMTDRYMSMMDNYYNLISEFPETRHLREVEQMRDEAREYIETATSGQTADSDTNDTESTAGMPLPQISTTTTNGN